MEVPKGYARKAKASAEDIPRETIAILLTRLLPRVSVARRKVEPDRPNPARIIVSDAPSPAPVPAAFRTKGKRTRKTPKYPSRAIITTTAKGLRKLRRFQDTQAWKNLKTLSECESVRVARNRGLLDSDISYASRVGTITVSLDGEYL